MAEHWAGVLDRLLDQLVVLANSQCECQKLALVGYTYESGRERWRSCEYKPIRWSREKERMI